MRSGCRAVVFLGLSFLLASPLGAEEAASSQSRVTLQFQSVDILEVLKILAEQAGFNLVAGRNVSGQVTLFVKEVDPWEALEVILAANELAYERRGQILTILTQRDYELLHGAPYRDRRVLESVPLRYAKAADVSRVLAQVKSNIGRVIADESSNTLIFMDTPSLVEQMIRLAREMDQPLKTRVFSLNYGAVKVLAPVLQESVTKGVGRISVDERTNQAVVTDTPEKLDELERMIRAFDERPTEVLIDAKIVQVNLSDKFQMGIDWQHFLSKQLNLQGLAALNLTSGGKISFSSLDAKKAGESKILLEALRAFGDTRLLSEPRITVMNNQESKILVGSKEPYITTQISQAGTGTAVTAETVSFIDIGVKLFVTPTISRDGFVSMKIRPEVSSRTGTLTTGQKNEIPIVETSEAETVLIVEDGGTVILGGLVKDEVSTDQQRIPLLGDIPLLGRIFRSQKDTVRKTELVVFLTPHILAGRRGASAAGAAGLAPPAADSRYRDQLSGRIQRIADVQASVEKARGTVEVSLTLTPDGRLAGLPTILRTDSRDLEPLARQAVMAASPFPPFPPDSEGKPTSFVVAIAYE